MFITCGRQVTFSKIEGNLFPQPLFAMTFFSEPTRISDFFHMTNSPEKETLLEKSCVCVCAMSMSSSVSGEFRMAFAVIQLFHDESRFVNDAFSRSLQSFKVFAVNQLVLIFSKCAKSVQSVQTLWPLHLHA